MHTTRYMIIEDGQPMDGAIHNKQGLFDALLYADEDAEIVSFDLSEVLSPDGGTTPMRLCTEDLVTEWWSGDGSRDVWERVVAGKSIGLASRFFGDEVASMEARAA
jgi:hypothetical protein